MGRRLRAISRTIRRRTGEAKAEVLALTEQTGRAARAFGQGGAAARRDRAGAGRAGRGAQAKLRAARRSTSSPIAARRSPRRSSSACAARRSPTGSISLVRSRCPTDPQGQARQADRVRVRRADRRDHPEHQARRARPDPAGRVAARAIPSRTRCCPRPSPSSTARALAARRSRWTAASRLGPTNDALERPRARAAVHRRPPTARLQTHPTPAAALPHRRRGTHQPPQTRLRPAPQPPERR